MPANRGVLGVWLLHPEARDDGEEHRPQAAEAPHRAHQPHDAHQPEDSEDPQEGPTAWAAPVFQLRPAT